MILSLILTRKTSISRSKNQFTAGDNNEHYPFKIAVKEN